MNIIKIEFLKDGTFIDTSKYANYLNSIKKILPKEVYDFANDSLHYDYHPAHCIHDLKLSLFRYDNILSECTMEFIGNKFKHDGNLTIKYTGVYDVHVEKEKSNYNGVIKDLIADEIRLNSLNYVTHELQFYGGKIIIRFQNLAYQWGNISIQ